MSQAMLFKIRIIMVCQQLFLSFKMVLSKNCKLLQYPLDRLEVKACFDGIMQLIGNGDQLQMIIIKPLYAGL
jgi:hypothetical protein